MIWTDKQITNLSKRAIELSQGKLIELEKVCWVVVHEYHHGVKPSEYDIREINEELYLKVLERSRLDI